jgi:hypothetical protein
VNPQNLALSSWRRKDRWPPSGTHQRWKVLQLDVGSLVPSICLAWKLRTFGYHEKMESKSGYGKRQGISLPLIL